MQVTTFLKLYPSILSVCAIAAFVVCEWFHRHDARSRKAHEDISLKYTLISGPQLGAALLLLYYGCTFHRRDSDFAHQLMTESCLHQTLSTLLVLAVLHSGFSMMISGCCAFPHLCPVDVEGCRLHEIIQCPERLASMPHYDFVFRSAQAVATCILLAAMSSVSPVHTLKHLQSRYRRAEFLQFDRHERQRPLSPTVRL